MKAVAPRDDAGFFFVKDVKTVKFVVVFVEHHTGEMRKLILACVAGDRAYFLTPDPETGHMRLAPMSDSESDAILQKYKQNLEKEQGNA